MIENKRAQQDRPAPPSSRRGSTRAVAPSAAELGCAEHASELDKGALARLLTWLSPAYPIGAYSYSSGIEWAVESGDICDGATLHDWLAAVIGQGGGLSDAVFFVHAYRAAWRGDGAALRQVREFALALTPSKERYLETTAQGRAFVEVTNTAWPCPALADLAKLEGDIPLPVAVAVACAGHRIPLGSALHGFVLAGAANLISAGMRLIPLGQTEGQRLLALLEPVVAQTAAKAKLIDLEEVASGAIRADLASMHHETQHTRLFRT